MKESDFQRKLIEKLENRFPGSIVMKNDPTYIQGIPDLTMLYKNTYVLFECKRSKVECKRSQKEKKRNNQGIYINKINDMGGLAYFIYPENMEEILDEVSRNVGAESAS